MPEDDSPKDLPEKSAVTVKVAPSRWSKPDESRYVPPNSPVNVAVPVVGIELPAVLAPTETDPALPVPVPAPVTQTPKDW